MKRSCYVLGLLAASWCASACTHYQALSTPPPDRVAELNRSEGVVTLSPGVALGLECVNPWGNPCAPDQVSVADPRIAKVYLAHLGHLEEYTSGSSLPTSFVVVGVQPGETMLTVPGEDPLRIVVVAER